MNIIEMKVSDLIPYEKNPRRNDDAVEYVAKSIKEFGFKVPIVVDKNNIVVTGHTRLKASKKLGLKTVPCIIADDFTDEQVKAFRLADNSVAEFSEWDEKLLTEEMAELMDLEGDLGFSMEDFGFNFDDDGEFGLTYEEIEAELPYENLEKARFEGVGEYDIPKLEPLLLEDYVDVDFIPFSDLGRSIVAPRRREFGVHYFIQDYTFEAIWRNTDRYVDRLLEHEAMITPDFSMYIDFPKALRIFNHYRNMWVGAYMQSKGMKVIPNVGSCVDGNEWFLDGMPSGGVVAFSTHGGIRNDDNRAILVRAYERMMDELKPTGIVWFGGVPKEIELPNDVAVFQKKEMFPLKKFYEKKKKGKKTVDSLEA